MSTALATQPRTDLLSRKFAARILSVNKGINVEFALKVGETLAESGVSAVQAALIIEAVYRPTSASGMGASTRAKWYVQAIRERHGKKLEKIANNIPALRAFIAEREEEADFRDGVNAQCPVGISFHEVMLLSECGVDLDGYMNLFYDACETRGVYGAKKAIMDAAKMVKDGKSATIEAAIEFCGYTRGADE